MCVHCMCSIQQLILKERMRKLWLYCCAKRIKDEKEMEMKEKVTATASATAITMPSQLHIAKGAKYERNLQGIKKIAFVTDLTSICNWFLGACALTWASAVLLGSYIQQLSMWDYYDVSLLLFVEGLRFGLAAALRLFGYRLPDFIRWFLRSVAFSLPLGMGGFAVLSILPADIRHSIHHRISGRSDSLLHGRHGHMLHVINTVSHAFGPVPPSSDSGYRSLSPSLYIFYTLVLLNAFFLLLGSSVTGIMRRRYVRSNVKSLCMYHDKMLDSTTSWLLPAVDLDFAFQLQGSQYRRGRSARYVCEKNAELIWYLYMHEKGVEAAEAALAAEDGCVREAAANIMGFWAVLEALEEVQLGPKQLGLCFQRGMLSKLGDIADESYGSLGTAAARAFSLLLESVELELIGMVACVCLTSTGKDLIDILLSRTAELLHPPCPRTYNLPRILQEESHAHVYALKQYLHRLQSPYEGSDIAVTVFIEAQRAQLVKKVKDALPQMVMEQSDLSAIESLDNQLSGLLRCIEPDDHKNYNSDIQSRLRGPSPPPTWASPIKASFLLLCHVALPLVCLGVGFIVNALL